jgi:hypothetical protein
MKMGAAAAPEAAGHSLWNRRIQGCVSSPSTTRSMAVGANVGLGFRPLFFISYRSDTEVQWALWVVYHFLMRFRQVELRYTSFKGTFLLAVAGSVLSEDTV